MRLIKNCVFIWDKQPHDFYEILDDMVYTLSVL